MTSETNVKNLEEMKEFPYNSEFRTNPRNGKTFIVYICTHDDCNKEFLRTWNFLDHARAHKGIRPYQCSYCPKSFTQKGNFKKHLTQHAFRNISERKKYKCEFCAS